MASKGDIKADSDLTMARTRQWLKGIPYEVAFWRSYYASRRRRKDLFSWSQYDKPCQVDEFDIQRFIGDFPDENPLTVDLGCAMSYTFGNIFTARNDVRLLYIDPLAPFYNRILQRYDINRPRITFGMIETVSNVLDPSSAALIHVRNALDHCADPMRGIIECLASLKVGGVLYLNHFRNEAMRESYRGFHQWNIDTADNGRIILWNNSGKIDIAEVLNGVAEVETRISKEGRIVAIIRKVTELPTSLHNQAESARRASEMMLATVEYFHSLPNCMGYQFSRLYTSIGHRLMRLMPYSAIDFIKKALSRKS